MRKFVAFVSILMLVAVSVGYLLRLRGEIPYLDAVPIPIYPNSVPEMMPSPLSHQMPFGTAENLRSFAVRKGAGEVLDWYRRTLENRGYRIVRKQELMTVGLTIGPVEIGWLIFARDNEGIAVGVAETENGTFYLLASGEPSSLAGGEVLPASDQAEGVEPIPRYPGSVMLSHSVSYNQIDVTYGTPETNVTMVAVWFKQKLTEMGWEITNENIFAAFLSLRKGNEKVKIEIVPADFYSLIRIVHEIEGFKIAKIP